MRNDKLSLYADIRSALDGICELATAIGLDLSRHQIYSEVEAIPRALCKLKELSHILALVERNLSTCGSLSESGQRLHRPEIARERGAATDVRSAA